jgi:choline dehydrogenase-like flavoprotein
MATLAGEFLPFGRRNLVYLVDDKAERFRTYLNAVVSSWKVATNSEGSVGIESVEARSPSGGRVRVSAKQFIVAAGAIESARILLEVNEAGGGRIFPEHARVGAFLSDHLSCRIADVEPNDRAQVARVIGPRFANGQMRAYRYVESLAESSAPRSFAHFLFEIDNPAFQLAKETLFAIQSRRFPRVGVADVVRGFGGLAFFAAARYGRGRLFIPRGTPVHLQLDIEQAPRLENSIRLGNERDAFNRRVPIIRWSVSEQDDENIRTTAARILSRWPGLSSGLPALVPVLGQGIDPKPHDAYHPVGTCRLGSDDEAVVDLSLRTRGTRNLWVLSTGLFPTAGTANPTFSMLCLGDALADTLIAGR